VLRQPLVLLLSLAIALVLAGSAMPRGSHRVSLRVTSSIDGKKVLPLRIRWLAHPNVAASSVDHVDFLIDGKLRCVERKAPYNYGSDDFNGHLGYLVTTFLSPGRHRFTARAALTNGQKASDTVVARVLPAPAPPTELAGRWERTVTDDEVRKVDPTSVGDLPTGKWELVFDRIGAWSLSHGSGVVDHATYTGDTIAVDAAVWMVPGHDSHYAVSRYGYSDIGPGWREDGPAGSYHWSVSGNQLTLTVIRETHGPYLVRQAVWEGVWTRTT
jgi:hypothetical protein